MEANHLRKYKERYGKLRSFLEEKHWQEPLVKADRGIVIAFIVSYGILLGYDLLYTRERFLRHTVIPLTGLAAVSLIRRLINRKRPYEMTGIEPLIKREGTGESFPSRHVCSAVLIALQMPVPWKYGFLLLALLEVFLRTAAGVHYLSDTVVGFMFGLLWNSLLLHIL